MWQEDEEKSETHHASTVKYIPKHTLSIPLSLKHSQRTKQNEINLRQKNQSVNQKQQETNKAKHHYDRQTKYNRINQVAWVDREKMCVYVCVCLCVTSTENEYAVARLFCRSILPAYRLFVR